MVYILSFFKQEKRTPPIEKKLTYNIVISSNNKQTQLVQRKVSFDPKLVELTADVLEIFL